MRRMDELHLDYPVRGQPDAARSPAWRGLAIGRLHVATLMKRMGIEAIYRKPNTSQAGARAQDLSLSAAQAAGRPAESGLGHGHYLHPDGARLRLSRRRGRLVQPPGSGLRVSITMEADFCIEALEEALARYGRPEIFNTDQGSQFTSAAFTGVLLKNGIAISMDGKGSWRDNVFVERLWRIDQIRGGVSAGLRHVAEARASIGRYLSFYNSRRPHSSLDRQTPDQAYFNRLPQTRGGLNPAGFHLSNRKTCSNKRTSSIHS